MNLRKKSLGFMLIIISLSLLLAGCGQVASHTRDNNTVAEESTTAENNSVMEIRALKFLLDGNLVNGRSAQELIEASKTGESKKIKSPLPSSGFSAQSIDHKNNEFWEEVFTIQTNPAETNLVQNIEQKYRYYDRRTGRPFGKASGEFTNADWDNIDYIEELQAITINYLGDNKAVMTIEYHNKIIITDRAAGTCRYEKWGGNGSAQDAYAKIKYSNFVRPSDHEVVTLYIRAMHLNYDPQNGLQGEVILYGQNYCVLKLNKSLEKIQVIFYATYTSFDKNSYVYTFSEKNKMAELRYNKDSGYIETTYQIGAGCHYSDFSIIEGGIEDNCVFKLYPKTLSPFSADIVSAQNIPADGQRLQNIKFVRGDGTTAPIRFSRFRCKDIDNIYIDEDIAAGFRNNRPQPTFANCSFARNSSYQRS